MKRSSIAVMMVCLLGMFLMMGCGPSLKEYVAKSSNYYSKATSRTSVSVNIEPNKVVPQGRGILGAIGSAVNTASAVGALAISSDQRKRLSGVISTERVVTLVAGGFDDAFADTTHLTAVQDSLRPDLRINIKVSEFGLWSESLMSSMKFYVEADIQVVYEPELKTIYSSGATIMRETNNVFADAAKLSGGRAAMLAASTGGMTAGGVVAGVSSLASGAANLTTFFELTDDEIVAIFDYLSYDAGLYVADKLVRDIYD